MPVLDATALKSDRKGLAFLKAVLSNRSSEKAIPAKADRHPTARPAGRQAELNR